MKKLFAFTLAALLAFGFAACGNKDEDTSSVPESVASAASLAPEAAVDGGNTPENDALTMSDFVDMAELTLDMDEAKQAIVERLTPPGAQIGSSTSVLISMKCTENFEDLKAFYQEAVVELGISGTEQDLESEGDAIWLYMGTYEDGENITITVVSDGSVMIVP